MPWDSYHFPVAMKYLPEDVRNKAIEIANALLSRGDDEGRAIRIGIAQAKKWIGHQGYNDGGNWQ